MDDNKQNDDTEQGFNDDELQDIMNEIESLEKEFVEADPAEESPAAEAVEAAPEKTELQKAIDEEMESLEMEASLDEMEDALNEVDEFSDEDFEDSPDEVSNVHTMPSAAGKSSPMEIKACGQMQVNLAFQVAQETAHLSVDDKGLKVELNGVVVWIDAEKGCSIELPGGGKFSFPVQACTSAKKAA